jgi:serine/threonine protein kinase
MIDARIADRYVLLAPIGSGGEARVYRARDETSGTEVAVRLALAEVASVISAPPPSSHENWVRYFDSGIDPQHGAYQVFELLEGQTLGEIVSIGPLTAEEWREFVEESLETVNALHLADWVHGDLNADNFLRTTAKWKLLELPFFRFESPASRSSMFGSIFTLAPEQVDGSKASVRTDIYALGCLYYYAASARWPHAGASVQEVAIHSLMHPADPLRAAVPTLPAAWCDWVMTLIARRPEDRAPSAAAARQLLADAVA